MADLPMHALSRCIKALAIWLATCKTQGRPQQDKNHQVIKNVDNSLSKLGWSKVQAWRWHWSNHTLDLEAEKGVFQLQMHHLRNSWRLARMQKWLASQRNDANTARSAGFDAELFVHSGGLDKMRTALARLPGHARAVVVGGMATPATFGTRFREQCPYCCLWTAPTVDHILWSCSHFCAERLCARPAVELEARLGWSQNSYLHSSESLLVLQQMACIRRKEVEARLALNLLGCDVEP
ncbi:unnamed protein product [Polarella glacialis]|uniref:Reverse transcriptase zinc-binding domain-containing protein n=1 Tax=Polarella glacialis TaxID=89957 RepID=A0A813LAE9_POLGL|nr:unnamed protein product [Polarella glacialis]